MEKLIVKNGGSYSRSLTRAVTHLISPVGSGRKVEAAIKWKIHIVDPLWLEHSLLRKARVNEKPYSLSIKKEKRGQDAFVSSSGPAPLLPDHYFDEEVKVIKKSKGLSKKGDIWQYVINGLPNQNRSSEEIDTSSAWDSNISEKRKLDDTEEVLKESPTKKFKIESKSPSSPKGMFYGHTFAFEGFNESQIRQLDQVVKSHSARVSADSANPDVTNIIVNSKEDPATVKSLLEHKSKLVTVATEWFIERSLFLKEMANDIWGTYVEHRNIPELKPIHISISGFEGVELLHVEKLIPLLGASLDETFTRQTNLLVSKPNSSKFRFALKWNIPIVKVEWLWECAKTGESVPLTSEWVVDGRDYKSKVLGNSGRTLISEAMEQAKLSLRSINDENLKDASIFNTRKSKNASAIEANSGTVPLLDQKAEGTHLEKSEYRRKFVGKARVSTRNHSSMLDHISANNSPVPGNAVLGTQVAYVDQESLNDREALLNAIGGESKATVEFSQEIQTVEDMHPRRLLRKSNGRS